MVTPDIHGLAAQHMAAALCRSQHGVLLRVAGRFPIFAYIDAARASFAVYVVVLFTTGATISWCAPLNQAIMAEITNETLQGLRWLPDGGAFRAPDPVSAGHGFEIEAWWCPCPGRVERIQRCYDQTGSWISSRQVLLQR